MSSPLDRLRRRLSLDRRNGWIAGVCAGVARALGTDPALPRVGLVLAALFMPRVAIALYVIAWIVLSDRR